jgi:aldehyde dehydrogenase (NAD+)
MSLTSILKNQQTLFDSNKTKDVNFRISQLKILKEILKQNEADLYRAIYKDFGKSQFDTYLTELSQVYVEINLYLKKVKKWNRKKRVRTNLINQPARSYIIPEPLGSTLVIGAWNYPIYLSLMPVIAAIGAGNTVILKPSEISSNVSSALVKIINENFPQDYFHVIEGGVKETTELLKLKFDKIFFTGSTEVGKIVYQAAAKNLTPVTLELGGKSPTFVLHDCNIAITVKRIVWSKFLNAGQTCVAPDYILVDERIKSKFLEALKSEIKTYFPDQLVLRDNYTQIINDRHFNRLNKLIDKNRVFIGGDSDKSQRYLEPTLLQDITFDDDIMKEEIFGPILPVVSFSNLNEVIQKVKKLPKPLSCYIYSNDKKAINKVLTELSFGSGSINDSVVQLSNSNLPFGGVGASGMGTYHGDKGFETFSHYKSILHRFTWFEPSLKYFPYTKLKSRLLDLFLR